MKPEEELEKDFDETIENEEDVNTTAGEEIMDSDNPDDEEPNLCAHPKRRQSKDRKRKR